MDNNKNNSWLNIILRPFYNNVQIFKKDNDKKINWLDIILNAEFQNAVQFKTLVEVSMVSKLAREKLKPVVFKRIGIFVKDTKFDSNVLSIDIEQHFNISQFYSEYFKMDTNKIAKSIEFDYHSLKEIHSGIVQGSFNDYGVALKDIKKHSNNFYLGKARNVGYYLYPLINGFDNLTSLTINDCNIPFTAFSDIGKALSNLNKLGLYSVNLVKLYSDIITSGDISFPANLTSLMIFHIQIATTDLLLDPIEYLLNTKTDNYTYEHFVLPKLTFPILKRLNYAPSKILPNTNSNLGLEEFLNANPKLESLNIMKYNLKMNSSLNSLKFLEVDDNICFNSITNISSLDNINNLTFNIHSFDNTANFSKLCRLCPNLVELSLFKSGFLDYPQALIDKFLTPALPNLFKLKTLHIGGFVNDRFRKTLDFTNFTQIEELVLSMFSSMPNYYLIDVKA
ncbi:hypothetical protein CONCODRAFT_20433 [Conidiobolus coronatus NRRL 28638]|uniref:RNI-like protein n=1 Tax=Conidiobolus coronatus (strain ATCC 28846 / CBS 209.66 / NRRL 28638) TaxID=796925 RepID=A0A137NTH8_CONC2|nr:hypothetical protein CONCODRAFT_20433 [Conidiobolus coronatus NRRL 28638]|eukprot:KXN66077.1 hypothetical protein CONCODRAFT_20433 [Conidiobolus coronatus NRRL 28638]